MTRRSIEVNPDGIVGQARGSVTAGNRSAQHGSHRAMNIAHRQFDHYRCKSFQRRLRLGKKPVIQRLFQAMILRLHAPSRHARRHGRIMENGRQIQAAPLPVIHGRFHVEHVDAPDHLVHAAEAHLRHVLPHLLRQKEEEVDDVLGLPLKALAQHRILRGDAH